jgi:hypothetical protein
MRRMLRDHLSWAIIRMFSLSTALSIVEASMYRTTPAIRMVLAAFDYSLRAPPGVRIFFSPPI